MSLRGVSDVIGDDVAISDIRNRDCFAEFTLSVA